MSDPGLTRRDSMLAMGAAAAGMLALGASPRIASAADSAAPTTRKRALRIGHLTDMHVEPELRSGEGLTAAFHHVQQLADKPDLIISGGDHVMDSLECDDARATTQWDVWNRVLKNECSLPVRSCIGNHDAWGWIKSKSHTTGDEPLWGKKRAVEMLHLSERYYAFPQAGWQIIVLDSVHPNGEGYTAKLDEPQFDWLKNTLRDTPATTPIMIVSHIPILSASALLWSKDESGYFKLSKALMHSDCVELKDLFAKYPNLKLCISGHLHLDDRVDYNGVTYFCNGAVSGNWWKGRHKDCDEGYAVVNLYDDGTFDREYIKYGWKAAV